MQVFFAISCLLAVLALSNGASIAPNSEQPRAELETLDAVSVSEALQVAEAAGQARAAEVQANEEVASNVLQSTVEEDQSTAVEAQSTFDTSVSGTHDTAAPGRKKRTLHHHLRHGCRHPHHRHDRGCAGTGCTSGCAGSSPCAPGTAVVQQDVPVVQPVPVPVPVVNVVHQSVPVPRPVLVPVVKEVRVPVPVGQPTPCCSQPQPCCGQPALPCSPCSG